MHPLLETDLALVLFLPTFCVIAALYCAYPRSPRTRSRWMWDLLVVAGAAVCSAAAMRWGFRVATGVGSAIWRQLLATLLAYGAFAFVIGCALLVRGALSTRSPCSGGIGR